MPVHVLNSSETDPVLQALRLGYLVVEAYSPLQNGAPAVQRPADTAKDGRFEFTVPNRQSRYYQMLQSAAQLHALAERLQLPTPPLPAGDELEKLVQKKISERENTKIKQKLDDWARQAGLQLSLRDERMARAFAFGGSFASTYWTGLGSRGESRLQLYARMLAPGRLHENGERLESLRDHMPLYTVEAIRAGLGRWGIGPRLQKAGGFDLNKSNFANQFAVWRDMIFGRRPPESFLGSKLRVRINTLAFLSTAAIVMASLFMFWLILWSLPALADYLDLIPDVPLPSERGASGEFLQADDFRISELFKSASALVATISAVSVFIAGVIARVSGWILRLHEHVDFWFRCRAICRRTLRAPRLKSAA